MCAACVGFCVSMLSMIRQSDCCTRETDKLGKVRWRSSVACTLSAEKSGIFQKTGRKQEGQIVWQLDEFKATNELKRHAVE